MYNLGNVIALTTGLALQLAAIQPGTGIGAAIHAYFFGSPGATWLTVAILIFFASGEVYHRAWVGGAPPDTLLNRIGDLMSAVAAVALALALLSFGDVALAIVSGTLLFGGKLGTALIPEIRGAPARANRLPAAFRMAVVVSRFPAMAGLGLEIGTALAGGSPGATVAPGIVFLCYAIWLRADLMFKIKP
ncbi:hypothetical protein LVO79_07285 [Roseivivax marinus]|uniref:hypothetical protein n=1 Tax=Roseivivax marinus TaxID=1379903 RepID=UPI001F042EDD|nr:hypothetical protein [Roseivivax marinus]UMA66239.1 hypothetical protein LVO79_07285 [Roseivivax marinus]